jgi:hypothetical protein
VELLDRANTIDHSREKFEARAKSVANEVLEQLSDHGLELLRISLDARAASSQDKKRAPGLQDKKERPRDRAVRLIEESIVHFAIRDWSKPPFGAACHAWAPGIDVPAAIRRLSAFSLVGPGGLENMHICGEAYSDYQGFVEGALRSAEAVLHRILRSIENLLLCP